MKGITKSIALLLAFSLLFASNAQAFTAAPQPDDDSTTEKVLGALAIGAVAGIAYYVLTDNDDHYRRGYGRHYDRRDYRRGQYRGYDRGHYGRYNDYRRGGYIAFNAGFSSFSVSAGYRYGHHRGPKPYWHRHGNIKFYRVPYSYHPRYDQAFNSGWERGYWAGYLQGRHDASRRYRCQERFIHHGNSTLWGYNHGVGSYSNYSRAFTSAYSKGYLHAYQGRNYGYNNFGFGGGYSY